MVNFIMASKNKYVIFVSSRVTSPLNSTYRFPREDQMLGEGGLTVVHREVANEDPSTLLSPGVSEASLVLQGLGQPRLAHHRPGGQKFKIKVSAGPCSLSRLSGKVLPCLFQLPAVASNPGRSLACSCITPVSASVITWFSPCVSESLFSLIRTPAIVLEPPYSTMTSVYYLHLQRPRFQIRSHKVPGLGFKPIFWGT